MKYFILILFISFTKLSFGQKLLTGYLPVFRIETMNDVNYDQITHGLLAFGNPNKKGELFYNHPIDSIINILHDKKGLTLMGPMVEWGFKIVINRRT